MTPHLRRAAAALAVAVPLALTATAASAAPHQANAVAAPAATVQPWPVVSQGAHRHPVRTLQRLLRARGFSLTVDGVFGPTTRSRVVAFQRSRGLPADGIVGPRTWAALVITIRKGNTGEATAALDEEIRFRDLRCGCYPIDLVFSGPEDGWVRAFQHGVGITADGIVGPVTWRALVAGQLAG